MAGCINLTDMDYPAMMRNKHTVYLAKLAGRCKQERELENSG